MPLFDPPFNRHVAVQMGGSVDFVWVFEFEEGAVVPGGDPRQVDEGLAVIADRAARTGCGVGLSVEVVFDLATLVGFAAGAEADALPPADPDPEFPDVPTLANRRMDTIRNMLVERGVPPQKIGTCIL